MSDLAYVGDAINELTKAVKTQDNHVLSDLDTYRIESVLSECLVEFKGIHSELKKIRECIQNGDCE